ncbi:MAG: polyprenyl synthetase family protein [Chitinophagaceae bacterium]|nr:polyprenyl synthetase family protein [Chitinophagaceae bacterium]
MIFSADIISKELAIFESRFKESLQSNVPLLDRILKYIVKTKGKQLRPMFVLLSAKLSGEINDSTYRAASLVELLHTATLVHDDVVDESFERRNVFSVFALWKSKVSILTGDYLLAKGLLLSLDNDDFKILQLLSRAVKEMSEGELLQLEKSRSLNLDESVYFQIIKSKTASLLASACAAGAYSSSQNLEITEKLRQFGEYTGIAFQIKDDLFDYGTDDVGKPTGNDIKEKKLTLPLIFTLNKVDSKLKKELIYIIKNQNRKKDKVNFIIETVVKYGGIKYATEKMDFYRDKALQILEEFPASEVRTTLTNLVNYTTIRKK